jgi:two-component system, cell cycle sensor histidine kinase and response regulator CckA
MKTHLRALVIEDSEDDAFLLLRELDKGGYDVFSRIIQSAAELQQALTEEKWDVVLCDYALPGFNGEAALRIVSESGLDLPFIFVSGTMGEDMAVAAMKAGAHDYIMKGNLKRLAVAVRRELLDAIERRLHRAAEMQLRNSEHKYRHLFQNMREAALLIAEDSGKIIDANRQAEHLFGLSRAELIGLPSAEICPAGETGAMEPPKNGRSWPTPSRGESTVRRQDGSETQVDVGTSRVELHNRPFLLTLLRDISARKRAETATRNVLRHARTMLMYGSATTATSPDPTGKNPSTGLRWSWQFHDEEAARSVLSLRVEESQTYAEAWSAAILPDDARAMNQAAANAFTSGAPGWQLEFRCRDEQGDVRWFVQTASVESHDPGRWQAITINTDITERKRAEEALTWKTAFFEAQVESALDGILVVDRDGRKILQNHRFNEIWKLPSDLADGADDALQVAHASHRTKSPDEFAARVAWLYDHPDAVSREEIELDDGTVLDRYSSPVRDRANNYYGRIWTFRDLTDRRRLEEQYRQSQKMEAVGQLAGGIAHDFNNMLTVVQMHASLLLEDPGIPEPVADGLQPILDACDRAANLTRQLLTFSRRQKKSARPLDLREIFDAMLKLLRRVLGEEISLETRFSSHLPLVQADPGMMEQVLMNLVVNARDAMAQGGRLSVALESLQVEPGKIPASWSATPGTFVRLSVSDTGTGISPDILPRIFEPFFTTKEVGRGTGLGLATVFGIVEQHQGWVDVATEVGCGTTFHIYLPAGDSMSEPAATPTRPAIVGGGDETILLVEDDPAVRAVAAPALRRRGYEVIEAGCAQEAMTKWSSVEGSVDLLLTDLVLPGGVSGQVLAEQLHQRQPDLITVFTSGYSEEILSGRLQLKEGTAYLAKPYRIADLAVIVRQNLDRQDKR